MSDVCCVGVKHKVFCVVNDPHLSSGRAAGTYSVLIELLLYVLSISCFAIMYTQTENREYLRKKWVFVEFHSQLFFNNQICDSGETVFSSIS